MWTTLGIYLLAILGLQDLAGVRGVGIPKNQTCDSEKLFFQCLNSTQCIKRELLCNEEEDCPNGSDEWEQECRDRHIDYIFDKLIGIKIESEEEDESSEGYKIPCDPDTFPSVCQCTIICTSNTTHCTANDSMGSLLDCSIKQLTNFPDNVPENTIELDLKANKITTLRSNHFMDLVHLRELDLTLNHIQVVDDNLFNSLEHIEELKLEGCNLRTNANGLFGNLETLVYLDISHNGIISLEDDDFEGLTSLVHLDLEDNIIEELPSIVFDDLKSLKQLYLSRNPLTRLDNMTFRGLEGLGTLYMVGCKLEVIPNELFTSQHNLNNLDLAHNRIASITAAHLVGLTSLQTLNMKDNLISYIEPYAFRNAPLVAYLHLDFNRITFVSKDMFDPLEMESLMLRENYIKDIEDGALANQVKLTDIELGDNLISELRVGTFTNLSNLVRLNLLNNSIKNIEMGCFDPLIAMQFLDLRKNPFVTFPPKLFDALGKQGALERLYFDRFYMCGFATYVRHCLPRSDGISTVENLLGNTLLRSAVWIVAILAFAGNICVLLARCFLREDNRIHSFFITNLAVADLLMGLYLIIIGAHDILFRGEYIKNDIMWRSSLMCKLCGFLSFLSSEMSVMTLAVITLDRFICIIHPFKFKNRFLGQAAILMICLWVIWIALSALPLLHPAYFGHFYYGANSVCLPLQINYPYEKGWEFSLIIFVIFNLVAFVFIVYAYLKMFLTIRGSNLAMRSTKKNQEWPLVKRFGLIVLTDFLCWMPIIIMKFIAFGGVLVSNSVYAWFAIFVLPVNSALNPVLYTMTTTLFKQKILIPLGILPPKRTKPYEVGSSVDDSLVSKTSGTRLSVISSKTRSSVHATKACPPIKTNGNSYAAPKTSVTTPLPTSITTSAAVTPTSGTSSTSETKC